MNKQITSLKNVETDNFKLYEKDYFNNKIYDSLSRNILHFKLVNNSSKKYFIVLNENYLGTFENDYYLKFSSKEKRNIKRNIFAFNFYKNDSILSGQITLLSACGAFSKRSPTSFQYSLDSLYIENLRKSKQHNTKYIGLQNKDVLEKSITISPGETRYFTSIVNLPLRKNGEYWLSHVDTIQPNLASISILNNKKYTSSLLSNDQKGILKRMDLYDGIITSNKVPVKLIKMPKKKIRLALLLTAVTTHCSISLAATFSSRNYLSENCGSLNRNKTWRRTVMSDSAAVKFEHSNKLERFEKITFEKVVDN